MPNYMPGSPGRLVDITDELGNRGKAFLPDPLPPTVDLGSKALRRLLSEADRNLARLDGIAQQIERPEILFQSYLRREAVLSSRIEGTHTTLAELALFEAAAGPTSDDDARAVQNYVRAFQYGRERLRELPVGVRLLDEVHRILMGGGEDPRTTPGMTRDCTVLIGSPRLTEARFVPPPALFVRELLENLEHYLQNDDEPPLLRLAIAHYQFETIHPYRDGNGRIGRLLISLFLEQLGILTVPMLYISAYFERNQQRYYDLLLEVSTSAGWEVWISFFLEGVARQARDAVERTRRLTALRSDYHGKIRQKRASQSVNTLIDALFVSPVMSVPIAMRLLDITYAAAKPHLTKLIDHGILEARPIQIGKTKFYIAADILRALEEPV